MVSIPLPFNENPFGINVDVEISVAKEIGNNHDPFDTYNSGYHFQHHDIVLFHMNLFPVLACTGLSQHYQQPGS